MSEYDIITGHRADNCYFTYAEDFICGAIYKDTLDNVLRNGDPALQVLIKSKEAFKRLNRLSDPELVDMKYWDRFIQSDIKIRQEFMDNSVSGKKQRIFDFI